MAALIACGYLLAFGDCAVRQALRAPRAAHAHEHAHRHHRSQTAGHAGVRRALDDGPRRSVDYFCRPRSPTPYVTTSSCADYAMHGGRTPPLSTAARLLRAHTHTLGSGFLLYTIACRRPPKRKRIMPLNPFPIWPIIGLILTVIVAVLLLMIRAGNDWWERESMRLDGSNTKTTTDFEDIIAAVIFVMLCLGLLTGVLNQRHMVANLMLNVPRGRIPVLPIAGWPPASPSPDSQRFAFPIRLLDRLHYQRADLRRWTETEIV